MFRYRISVLSSNEAHRSKIACNSSQNIICMSSLVTNVLDFFKRHIHRRATNIQINWQYHITVSDSFFNPAVVFKFRSAIGPTQSNQATNRIFLLARRSSK